MLKLNTFSQQRDYLLQQPQFQGKSFNPTTLDHINSEIDFEAVRKVENTISDLTAEIELLGDSSPKAMKDQLDAYIDRRNSFFHTVESILTLQAKRSTERAKLRENNTSDVAEFKKELEAFIKPFWDKAGKTSNVQMVDTIRSIKESAGIK